MRDAIKIAGAVALTTLSGTAFGGVSNGDGPSFVVADSAEDFGGNQGENGWFYGYYDGDAGSGSWKPADFELMNVYEEGLSRWWVDNSDSGPLTLIDAVYMHPNASLGNTPRIADVQWSVRRWVSTVDGPVNLHVDLSRGNPEFAGDGIKLHVFIDGVQSLVVELFANNDAGLSFDLAGLVEQGSVIDFAIDPIGDAVFDAVQFHAVITSSVPTPGAMALVGLGGLVAGRRRR